MRSTFKQFLAEDSSLSGAKLGLRFDLQLKALDVNNEDAQSFRGAAGLAASSLSKVLNEEVLVKSLASASPSKTRWTIQPSENPSKNGFFSAVISTPVLYTSALTQAVKKLSSWLEAQDAETTDSDSLTAVIDVKGLSEKLDPVKLVLFLDLFDPSLVFSGELKKFSPPDVEVAIQQVKHNGKLSGFKNLQKAALSALGQRRDGYTNFSKLQDGLIEFRLGGGSGYEHLLQGFIKKALKLARAVELAGDPASEKAEYVQRLRALLTGSEGALQVSKDQKNVPVEILDRIVLPHKRTSISTIYFNRYPFILSNFYPGKRKEIRIIIEYKLDVF